MTINPENLIKARIAETIVEDIFRKSGYQVYTFGYKPVLQNLIHNRMKSGNEFSVGKAVASMPDFLLVKGELQHFLEVKFRSDGKLNKTDITSWNQGSVLLVFPFPPYFKIAQVPAFIKNNELHSLEDDGWIPIHKKTSDEYVPLIEKYLKRK